MSREKHHQFYLLVYPQTDADVSAYVCGGGLDIGLNETGMEEARKIARRFRKNPLKVKRIIGSPELRAVQMADILHDEVRVKMILWQNLADQFMGEWEGKPQLPEMTFEKPPRGELASNFAARVGNAADELVKMDEDVFVVTHRRVAKELLKKFGLGAEVIEPGKVYNIDLPAGGGQGHLREI